MAIILHIDTAVETASVCLAEDEQILGIDSNQIQEEHSSWLHPAINRVFEQAGKKLKDIHAVAVTIGPGSYTGLRVGLSAAKGLCYALDKPLISINTLELMAAAQEVQVPSQVNFVIPVIDARRMEVFTAVYDQSGKELITPGALILDEHSYSDYLNNGFVLFTGNAVGKLRSVIRHDNVLCSESMPSAGSMTKLASGRFSKATFSNLAYLEPLYVKEFFQPNH